VKAVTTISGFCGIKNLSTFEFAWSELNLLQQTLVLAILKICNEKHFHFLHGFIRQRIVIEHNYIGQGEILQFG
jgi:hypothetical protein